MKRVYNWAFVTRHSGTLGREASYLVGYTKKRGRAEDTIYTSAIVTVDGRALVTATGSRYFPCPHRDYKAAGLILPE